MFGCGTRGLREFIRCRVGRHSCAFTTPRPAFSPGGIIGCSPSRKTAVCGLMQFSQAIAGGAVRGCGNRPRNAQRGRSRRIMRRSGRRLICKRVAFTVNAMEWDRVLLRIGRSTPDDRIFSRMSRRPTSWSESAAQTAALFDGTCHFCRRWIERWQEMTAGRVDYLPYQEALAKFSEIPARSISPSRGPVH